MMKVVEEVLENEKVMAEVNHWLSMVQMKEIMGVVTEALSSTSDQIISC